MSRHVHRPKPIKVTYGLNDPTLDKESRIITAECDFFLFNIYTPSVGEYLTNMNKRLRWDQLLRERAQNLDKIGPVIIVGDFIVSHFPIDLAHPRSNKDKA